jgi:VWFA-related protein
MPWRWCPVGLALSLLVASGAGAGQIARFASRSELVTVSVTVKDADGGYVGGLPASAFQIREDGRPQAIRFFVNEDVPVTVGLLVDASGSMRANRRLVVTAASAFAAASHPDDELFALTFSDDVLTVLPESSPFTSDRSLFLRALSHQIVARGRTALYDAVAAGLEYAARGTYDRKVLVVISDGGDNASVATHSEVARKAQASAAVIYGVALADGSSRDAEPKRLRQLARQSGGEAFSPKRAVQVEEALRQVARDIRNAYTVAYVPADVNAREGSFRKISVSVKAPDGRRLIVRTRSGYLGSSDGVGGRK